MALGSSSNNFTKKAEKGLHERLSNIEWTDATPIIDRGGRRTKFY